MRQLPFIVLSILLLLGAGCSTVPVDPLRAIPVDAGLVLYWQRGTAIPETGFSSLDGAIRELADAVPARDSLEPVPYAAFAYNLRLGELAAGLAVATDRIAAFDTRQTDIVYRGASLFQIDTSQLLCATYENLSLIAREAVIIQEMIDHLMDGTNTAGFSRAMDPTVQALRYTLPELGVLFSAQTNERSRAELAQWATAWQSVHLYFKNDTLVDWHLRPVATPPATAAINCLPSVPDGVDHFTILPVPATARTAGYSANWSTYFAPWLGTAYARIATNEGSVLALCPRDQRLMQDLLDRLEREFAVAERKSYPNGTILRTEAPGLNTALLTTEPADTWLLRGKEQTYLASNPAALEKILDLQLLAGPQSLPPAIRQNAPDAVLLARLNASRLADRMTSVFSDWSAPEWWPGLAGWWSGTIATTDIALQRDAAPAPDSLATDPPSTRVAWRWDAPMPIESIHSVPGTTQCAVYLQDGTLVVLNEQQQEQLRTRLDFPPNSPIYRLPATPDAATRWLFSTPAAVHLIDTAGQAVSGFPYRPAGGLATGLILDDLDRAGDPAYFVPLRTGRIEAYSLRGLPLVNWAIPTDFCAAEPLLTLHSDTRTYLAVIDTLSRVRVFDRRGSVYLAFDSLPNPVTGPLFGQLTAGMGPGRLAALELDGRIRVMSLAGGQFPLRATLPNGAPRQLLFTDLWGDRRKDYLVSRADAVALYAYEKRAFAQRWQAQLPGTIDRVFVLPALRLVGGLDLNRGLIYLLNGTDGRLLDPAGLAGRSPGQELIAPDGGTLLITAYNRTLYAYQVTERPSS